METSQKSERSMNFGDAIVNLRLGEALTRFGWNGKGMWIKLYCPGGQDLMTLPYLYMLTAQGEKVPWLASHSDILANDWLIA